MSRLCQYNYPQLEAYLPPPPPFRPPFIFIFWFRNKKYANLGKYIHFSVIFLIPPERNPPLFINSNEFLGIFGSLPINPLLRNVLGLEPHLANGMSENSGYQRELSLSTCQVGHLMSSKIFKISSKTRINRNKIFKVFIRISRKFL